MRFKLLVLFVLVYSSLSVFATGTTQIPDTVPVNNHEVLDTDEVLEQMPVAKPQPVKTATHTATNRKNTDYRHVQKVDTSINSFDDDEEFKIPAYIEPVHIDSLVLLNNPFFIDLVFMGYPDEFKYEPEANLRKLYYGVDAKGLDNFYIIKPTVKTPEQILADLRHDAREAISKTAVDLYVLSFDELPDPDGIKSKTISGKPITDIRFVSDEKMINATNRKLVVKKEQLGPWTKKANSLLQFSQNMASENWYQGGTSTMSVLGVLSGQLNYDNKKNVQWENYGEWRLGCYAVFNDSTAKRDVNTNDDVLKINSKLGIRAGDNLFYSGSVDFSTQFFNSYKAINSDVRKGTFLTPVRLNIGMGLDYKYKKLFSVMLAPVSYKYIYVQTADPKIVNPNLFGIKTGENHLSELGSSLKAQCSYSPFRELQLDSRFSFYTNYQKVEIDWEIVGNFIINRYLSTRLSLNPRYDNTVILAKGETAKIQFKELLSFGFSYKLLN